MACTLKRSEKLRQDSDFKRLFKGSPLFKTRLFVLYVQANYRKESRIGFVVSRKVSKKAVDRNRIRRLFSEMFRLNKPNVPSDIIMLARHQAVYAANQELITCSKTIFQKLAHVSL